VLLESVKALKTQDTSSHTSPTESESANLELFSSKTLKESSQPRQQTESQFSSMSSESWKDWVTEQRQEYSQRLKSAHLTRESESSSWPTATTRDWKDSNATVPPSRANPSKQTLGQRVAHVGLLDQANLSTTGKSQGSQQWATPRANKVHPVITEENREHLANRNKSNLEEEIAGHCGKAQGKLNPDWVEQLMGLPVGWTDLGSWAME